AQSIPASPCTATLSCPLVNRLSWFTRSNTRTVTLVPMPTGSQPRLEKVKLLVGLLRYRTLLEADDNARIETDSVAATMCSFEVVLKLKVNGIQWLLVTTLNGSSAWVPATDLTALLQVASRAMLSRGMMLVKPSMIPSQYSRACVPGFARRSCNCEK